MHLQPPPQIEQTVGQPFRLQLGEILVEKHISRLIRSGKVRRPYMKTTPRIPKKLPNDTQTYLDQRRNPFVIRNQPRPTENPRAFDNEKFSCEALLWLGENTLLMRISAARSTRTIPIA